MLFLLGGNEMLLMYSEDYGSFIFLYGDRREVVA
jgi:hypothetical protein